MVLALVLLLASGATTPAPTIAARTAGLDRHAGFLPWSWDARAGALLVETVPGEFLYSAGLAGGAGIATAILDRGQLGGLALCRFERSGPTVLLVQLPTTHRSSEPGEAARAVAESFPTSVLAALPVVAEEGERTLVDATDLLFQDTQALSILRAAKEGSWSQDRARSAFAPARSGAFPDNTELEARITLVSDDAGPGVREVLPDGRTMALVRHLTFRRLPEPGYTPLALDRRVGFLPTPFKDYGARPPAPLEGALATRWRLAGADGAVRFLVLHLDRAMPEPERSAAREAALWWNHAFAEAGIPGAIEIRDLPEGATFLDARYSGIEWIHRTERSWSFGEIETDPRTGEILHAVARIDSHRRRTTARMWRVLSPGRAEDEPPDVDEGTFVRRRLAYLVAHEVGHLLGLDHNWAATTFGWGSVMDYLGPHVTLAGGRPVLADAYPLDVGAYDRLAIRWGYDPRLDDGGRDRAVREARARGIVYPTPGDARWAEYDFGSDPAVHLREASAVRRLILDRFGPGQIEAGEPVARLGERVSLAYLWHRFAIRAAAQAVGGQYQMATVGGDGETPAAWVPAAIERAALDALVAELSPEHLDLPERAIAALAADPGSPWPPREAFAAEGGTAFSLPAAARALSGLVVDALLAPESASRLALPRGDHVTLTDVIHRLTETTWTAPVPSDERAAALRRAAERAVLEGLFALAASDAASPDARAAAFAELERMRTLLRAPRAKGGEGARELALREIREFLEHPGLRPARPHPPAPPPGRPWGASPEEEP